MRASTVLVALAPLAVMQVHAMGFLTLDDPKPKDCSACSKLAMPGNRSKCARICSETPTSAFTSTHPSEGGLTWLCNAQYYPGQLDDLRVVRRCFH